MLTNKIYTIGFTKKTAECFFGLLKNNNIDMLLDIRLNNSSQLAGFSKYPDIQYFLVNLCTINYVHDTKFAPQELTLKKYKQKEITWEQYCSEFNQTMIDRNINDYIKSNFSFNKSICLLCSEENADNCHRSLVATQFINALNYYEIVHL